MKSFVKNRAASEGCIAECYVGDEVVSFVERYYGQTMRNERLPRVDDNSNHISSNTLFPAIGKPVGSVIWQLNLLIRRKRMRQLRRQPPPGDSASGICR